MGHKYPSPLYSCINNILDIYRDFQEWQNVASIFNSNRRHLHSPHFTQSYITELSATTATPEWLHVWIQYIFPLFDHEGVSKLIKIVYIRLQSPSKPAKPRYWRKGQGHLILHVTPYCTWSECHGSSRHLPWRNLTWPPSSPPNP